MIRAPARIKLGVDPTAPDVHFGHTVVMRKPASSQGLGHTVVPIIGDYTAQTGDPSGRNKARPRLSHEQVLENAKQYQEQFSKSSAANRWKPPERRMVLRSPLSKVTEPHGTVHRRADA